MVAVAFLVAAIQKLRHGATLVADMANAGLPKPLARPVAVVLPPVELATAALLLVPGQTVGAWLAVGLASAFTGFVTGNLISGRRTPCPCFGAATRPASGWTLLRNAALLALAVVATA